MYQVVKRDGKVVDFNIRKISDAIKKAFEAQNRQYNEDIIDMLALKVTSDYEPKIKDGKVGVEEIQDSVEKNTYRRRLRGRGKVLHTLQKEPREDP